MYFGGALDLNMHDFKNEEFFLLNKVDFMDDMTSLSLSLSYSKQLIFKS